MGLLSYIYKIIDKRRLVKMGAITYLEVGGWMALPEIKNKGAILHVSEYSKDKISYRIFDESAKLIASLSADGRFCMGWDGDVAGLFLKETGLSFNEVEQAVRYAYLKQQEDSIKTLSLKTAGFY